MKRNGRTPIRYGGRTLEGWRSYYATWGRHTPALRTLREDYRVRRKRGLTDSQIIAEQKRLWVDGIAKSGREIY